MLEKTAAGLKAELLELGEIADANITKVRNLQAIETAHFKKIAELDEARHEAARGFVKELEADQVRDSLHAAYDNVTEAYEQRTAARAGLRDAKDAFAVAEANAIVLVKTSGELVEKDPATGRSNKDWIDSQVATMLEKHPDYQKAKKALHSAENRVFEADMNLDLAQSRLSVARNEARLVAAMLGVGGNNG